MARAIWSGVISFGLVTIPVKLYSATENKSISFHQLHTKCGTQIQEIRWCPECEEEVTWDEVAKGYEYSKGEHVIIDKEDLEKLPLPTKETVEIDSFVNLSDIDPIYFQKNYYLEPDKSAQKPFVLFIKTLVEKEKVAIAKVALRNREHLCCLRPVGNTLMLETLYYPDELRIDPKASLPNVKVTKQEMSMASHLVDLMSQEFNPEEFKDQYRDALSEIIEAKLNGKEIVKEKPKAGEVIDLMEALKASVSKAKKPEKSHKTARSKRRTTKRRTA